VLDKKNLGQSGDFLKFKNFLYRAFGKQQTEKHNKAM